MSRKRYEEEIEEILKKMDRVLPSKPVSQRARDRFRELASSLGPILTGMAATIQAGHLMLLSLALMLAAYFLPLPFDWKRDIGIVGLVLFFVAFVLSLLDRRRSRPEPRWRGRVIRTDQKNLPDWLRRFLGRR